MDGWMDWEFHILFDSILDISGQGEGNYEGLCTMKCNFRSGRISSLLLLQGLKSMTHDAKSAELSTLPHESVLLIGRGIWDNLGIIFQITPLNIML